jgi:hypothetical protein
MNEGTSHIVQEFRAETRSDTSKMLSAVPPSPARLGGAGHLFLLIVVGGVMFTMGASVALYQRGVPFPVFARQVVEPYRGVARDGQFSTSSVSSSAPVQREQDASEEALPSLESNSSDASSLSAESSPMLSSAPSSEENASVASPPPPDVGNTLESEAPPAPLRHLPDEIGVFLTERSAGDRRTLLATLEQLKTFPGSALVFTVKGGYVHFAALAPLAKELDLIHPLYNLQEVIALARERGIQTIGRFIAVKDPDLAQALPQTQIKHPKTGRSVGNVWVNPSHPYVLEYNWQILTALVEAHIDEINLDYIRFPTEYDQTRIGLTGQEKADQLEEFLRMARRVIDEHGGKTRLGISTYAILGWNYPVNLEPLGQDVVRFAPLLDVISPMAYPATFAEGSYYNPAKHPRSRMYYLVYRTLRGYDELLGEQSWKLRPWIQGYGITAKNLRDEIDAVFDAGACGFTVWNAENRYDLVYKVLPSVVRPERCS